MENGSLIHAQNDESHVSVLISCSSFLLSFYVVNNNPCEQIWKKLQEDSLSNRCFKSEEDIVQACCDAWNQFTEMPETVRSLCTRHWAHV